MKVISEKKIILNEKLNLADENNNFGISDTICQIIINKIITNAISKSINNKIYSKLNEHCFNFILNCIEPFLTTDFIFHENLNQMPNENNSNNLYYSIIPKNIKNTWVEIYEPLTPDIDRYHSIKTKIVKNIDISNQKKNNSEKELNNVSSKDSVEKTIKSLSKRSGNKLNTLKESLELEYHFSKDNSNTEIGKNEKQKNGIKKNNLKNSESKKIINNINDQKETDRRNTKNLIIDLPFYDLPKEAYENKYITLNNNEENNLLRIEREKDILNKEQQKNLEKIKNQKEYEKKFKIKLVREFDSNKITFDSNGNIINLNIPNTDSFSNDFGISKAVIKDLKMKSIISNKVNQKKEFKNGKFKKYFSANIVNSDKKEKDIQDNTLISLFKENSKKQKFEKKPTQQINFISNFKIMNPLKLNSIINQKAKIKIEYNPINEEEKKNYYKKRFPPSGSNFDKIIPEVGVIIQNSNDNKKKKGGFEYYSKYNKPSINEFSQLVNETLKLNQKLISSSLSSENINQNKKYDYNGYNQEFFDSNNPLIQNAIAPKSNRNKKIKSLKNELNNKSLIKNKSHLEQVQINNKDRVVFKSFDNSHNNIENKKLFNEIKLSQKILEPNLYSIFSQKDDENNLEEKKDIKNKNIFKSLKKRSLSNLYLSEEINKNNDFHTLINKNRKIYSLNKMASLPNIKEKNIHEKRNLKLKGEHFIDEFNTKILNNKNWGNYIYSERNLKIEQDYQNIFRKSFKLKKLKGIKELLVRRRVPHAMLNINSE